MYRISPKNNNKDLNNSSSSINNFFGQLEDDIRSVIERFTGNQLSSGSSSVNHNFIPSVDLEDTVDSYLVKAEVPGLSDKDIRINIDNNQMTISGEKKNQIERKEGGKYYFESSEGSFKRTIPFTEEIDEDRISAELKNGVLVVSIPKLQDNKKQKKQIEIKAI